MPEQLEKGWPRVVFGDVVQLCRERSSDPTQDGFDRYVGLEHLEPGDLKIRRWGDVANGTTFTSVFRSGQVLFGKRRAYQRKVAIVDFDGVCSGDIYVFKPKNEQLLPELLPFICQTDRFYEHAVGTSAGSLSPRTSWKSLANYEFALPTMYEQRRISVALGAAAEWHQSVRDLLVSAHQTRASFCRHLITGRRKVARTTVGQIAKFTSGIQIRVSELPQQRTPDASVPVYGGNGRAGYVANPLPECLQPIVVVGRVGQYCGASLLTDGPAWITDNALFPQRLKSPTDMRFLAACLEGANLNRGKLGEYLPLITQDVVHSVEIPFMSLEEQQMLGEQYQALINTVNILKQRVLHSGALWKQLRNRLLGEAT